MVTLIVYVLVLSLCVVHVCIQCSALKGSAVAAVKTQYCMCILKLTPLMPTAGPHCVLDFTHCHTG